MNPFLLLFCDPVLVHVSVIILVMLNVFSFLLLFCDILNFGFCSYGTGLLFILVAVVEITFAVFLSHFCV